MNQSFSIRKNLLGIAVVLFFLVFRMCLEPIFWRNISVYYSYLFESIFVVTVSVLYKSNFRVLSKLSIKVTSIIILNLLLGFLFYKASYIFNISIPFDFSSLETVLLLLFLAPVLEEGIFRLALWEGFQDILKGKWKVTLVCTSILFSLGHFTAYFFVPEKFHSFVLYQTVYTVILSLFAGGVRVSSKTVIAPILVHFTFNLGFYLASKAMF